MMLPTIRKGDPVQEKVETLLPTPIKRIPVNTAMIRTAMVEAGPRGITLRQIARKLSRDPVAVSRRMRIFQEKYRGRFWSEWVPSSNGISVQECLYRWGDKNA